MFRLPPPPIALQEKRQTCWNFGGAQFGGSQCGSKRDFSEGTENKACLKIPPGESHQHLLIARLSFIFLSVWKVGFSYSGRTTPFTTDWVVWTLLAFPCYLMSSHSSCGQSSSISQNLCSSRLPDVSPGIHSALLFLSCTFQAHSCDRSLSHCPTPDENSSSQVLFITFRHTNKRTPFMFIHKTPKR